MNIHEYLISREGEIWETHDTDEVERILREIDKTAQAAVQLEEERYAEVAARRAG